MRVGDVAEEVGVPGHLRQIRASLGVTEEVLREEYDQLEKGLVSVVSSRDQRDDIQVCGNRGGSGDEGRGSS